MNCGIVELWNCGILFALEVFKAILWDENNPRLECYAAVCVMNVNDYMDLLGMLLCGVKGIVSRSPGTS
jgi:hypothetical protein